MATFRKIDKGIVKRSNGFILDFNDDFVLLHETDDFVVLGYMILPVRLIKKIRHNKFDKCYQKIMVAEGEAAKVGISYKINLTDWRSIFKSIKATGLNIIVECEHPDIGTFTIGPISKTTKKQLLMENFDAVGIIDPEPVDIDFDDITIVKFDDRYINVFSKYLKRKKVKPE